MDDAYLAELDAFFADRVRRLRAPDGWLSIVDRVWLEPGDNTTPLGVVRVGDDARAARLIVADGLDVRRDGVPVRDLDWRSDADANPDRLEHAGRRYELIARDGRLGLRVRDPAVAARRVFRGVARYPVDVRWRIAGRRDGNAVRFELAGASYRLVAQPSGPPDAMFVVFGDRTNDGATYGGGRFLTVPIGADGVAIVDFNRAINPPCVFSAWTTCPLPPPENRLPLRIEAGELLWDGYPPAP